MPQKLYRSQRQKMLAGVCGGLAEYFNVDATLIRLSMAFLTFFTGIFPGLLFYLIAAVIIPSEPDGDLQ